jgi:glycerol-3-phosphate acyltransferase PlsY
LKLALMIGLAYLIGAIPTSYLAAKHGAGIDLREHGSKNLGATNVYRVLGWGYAIPVGLFDVAKGFVAAYFIAPWVGPEQWIPIAVGIGAILGHVFPVYLKFSGGKGVATAAGVVLGIAPTAALMSVLVWGALVFATGIVSVASMSAAIAFPLAVWVLTPERTTLVYTGAGIAGFIVFSHRSNIRRLWRGTEPRFGQGRREA